MWMAGASEVIYSTLMMNNGFIAPNLNFEEPDEASALLNIPSRRVETEFDTFLSNSFGFGGTNSSLIIRKFKENNLFKPIYKFMTNEEIIEKIRTTLAEEFEIDVELIQPDAPLMQTLELDSLDLVDMVVLIDRNFGFTVTAKDFAGIKTFQDFYNLVISHIQKED